MNKVLVLSFRISISLVAVVAAIYFFFGPVGGNKETEIFIIPQDAEGFPVADTLDKQRFIRNAWIVNLMTESRKIEPGGYRITKAMWAWQVVSKLTGKPDLVWVTVIGCQRREQIGELLQRKLGWDDVRLQEFDTAYESLQPEYIEGVYYPDTYLLPVDETGKQIAKRFIDRFNEKFAPYFDKFQEKNIRWVTALKIASLIEREAGGAEDMPIISGIIWNRLDTNMVLQIDATMQYTKGKKPDGSWWGGIDLEEKSSDSPYNTYLKKGLPPTPICSPSVISIDAVLHPAETDCIFYLHDKNKQIHCAVTYAEHKENISTYLQ